MSRKELLPYYHEKLTKLLAEDPTSREALELYLELWHDKSIVKKELLANPIVQDLHNRMSVRRIGRKLEFRVHKTIEECLIADAIWEEEKEELEEKEKREGRIH